MDRRIAALAGTLALTICATPSIGADETASTDFGTLIDEIGTTMLVRSPEDVTDLGLSAGLGLRDDLLNDLSEEYRLETARLAADALERLAGVDATALSPEERITQAVTEWWLEDTVTMASYADHEYAVNFITGAHANFPEFMGDVHPLEDAADAEAYVERLRASGRQMRQVADAFERSQDAGNLPTRRGLDIAAWQINNQTDTAAGQALVSDMEARLKDLGLPEASRDRLAREARDAVDTAVLPGYRDLLDVVAGAPARSDDEPGVMHHPGGPVYYAAALRHHTTTSLTPEEVHTIGLEAAARVQAQLAEALTAAGFHADELGLAGALQAANAARPAVRLESDEDRRQLLLDTESFIAGAQGAFGEMFSSLPAAPLTVQRPRPGREGAAGAYYRPPPVVGDRPGVYYLALGGKEFALDTYATTNYHEAVPGHHFQIALQRESSALPLVQRATTFTGYAEGWGLYAERLAYEAGLYADDPLGDIGRLRMELLRAARAVADTGIHAFGWSRDEAIDYLVGLGFPAPWATSEVDRYIVWPGQAPAYLIGMEEILRLRSGAQEALGDDFRLADFHDAILRHGSVPLDVLRLAVDDYIGSTD